MLAYPVSDACPMRLVPTRLARLFAVLLPVFLLAAVPAIAQDVPPVLPMLPLSDPILFPGLAMDITIRNPAHLVLIQDVAQGNRLFALVTLAPDPTPNEHGNRVVFPNGTLCRLEGLSRSDGRLVITARALGKIRVEGEEFTRPYRLAKVRQVPEVEDGADLDRLHRMRVEIEELLKLVDPLVLKPMSDEQYVNTVAFYLDLDLYERQSLLDQDGVLARAKALTELLTMKLAARP